jgi:hypothetical protein
VSGFTTTSTSAQRDQKRERTNQNARSLLPGAARFASQVGQLLAKGKVLKRKVRARAEGRAQGSKEAQDQGNHRAMMHNGGRVAANMAAPSSPPSGNRRRG